MLRSFKYETKFVNCRYGEIVQINLVRDKDTGKSKGFCFICYEDQRSTVLAVDNFNGIKVGAIIIQQIFSFNTLHYQILNRTIRVDHVENYKAPIDSKKIDAETKKLREEGCAPKSIPIEPIKAPLPPPQDIRETLADQITDDIKLPQRLPIYTIKEEPAVPTETELVIVS